MQQVQVTEEIWQFPNLTNSAFFGMKLEKQKITITVVIPLLTKRTDHIVILLQTYGNIVMYLFAKVSAEDTNGMYRHVL